MPDVEEVIECPVKVLSMYRPVGPSLLCCAGLQVMSEGRIGQICKPRHMDGKMTLDATRGDGFISIEGHVDTNAACPYALCLRLYRDEAEHPVHTQTLMDEGSGGFCCTFSGLGPGEYYAIVTTRPYGRGFNNNSVGPGSMCSFSVN